MNKERNYVCENGSFRLVTSEELANGRVCVDYIQGQIFKLNGYFNKCSGKTWSAVADGDTTGIMNDAAGQEYRTVVIGTQHWMRENLNYETDSSYCYNDLDSYCDKYGRLYTWNAAMKACPAGWHLPSYMEWNTLVELAEAGYFAGSSNQGRGGYRLKSKLYWDSQDELTSSDRDVFHFSAIPAGLRFPIEKITDYEGQYAYFWTSSKPKQKQAFSVQIYYLEKYVDMEYTIEIYGYSVRCLQDD